MKNSDKKSIINCHTHIFNGKNVPPYIAKSFIPWPFYFLLNVALIIKVNEFFKFKRGRWKEFKEKWIILKIRLKKIWSQYRTFLNRNFIPKIIATFINIWFILHALYFLFGSYIGKLIFSFKWVYTHSVNFLSYLESHNIFFRNPAFIYKILIILFVFFFINSGRKILWTIARYLLPYMKLVPDSKTLKFLLRYYHIVRFAGYEESYWIYSKLKNQYNKGTGFVVLPMDMEYMDAGKTYNKNGSYKKQMNALIKLKTESENIIYPFVFIDPRRIKEDTEFLKLSGAPSTGTVTLNDCLVKEYIETHKFNGFKIYPALGYYPFDEDLLLLWKYAADNQIPITTHSTKGTIFYRGKKDKKWDNHPVFLQANGKGLALSPLLLPELKNIDFSANFTNPLNYLCLLEEILLRKVIKNCGIQIKEFFGYQDDDTPLKYNLKNLKICFGHYGGDEEWMKYLERDRLAQVSNMFRFEKKGFNFFPNNPKSIVDLNSYLGLVWRDYDWFSIITNLMYKYDNVYADISYIIQNTSIYPLLKQVLGREKIQDRILFGTDFFVVRNHKSEKQLLSEVMAYLNEVEFDRIARENPRNYLKTSYCTIQ